MLQDTYSLKHGQDKILRRISVVFNESIPDQSFERLRLPGDPVGKEAEKFQHLRNRSPTPAQQEHLDPKRMGEEHAASPELTRQAQAPDDTPATRAVKFPAAAPKALLHAAAEAAAAMRAEGLLGDIASGLSAQSVGPVPPAEVLKEIDSVSGDVRVAEVMRINLLVARAPERGMSWRRRTQACTALCIHDACSYVLSVTWCEAGSFWHFCAVSCCIAGIRAHFA